MSCRDRLHHVALRGCLIAAGIFFSQALYAQDDAEKKPETNQPQQAERQTNKPLSIIVVGPVSLEREKAVETNWDKPECAKPQSHDEADLCEQRRMAEAAEETVTLNKIQIGLSVVGFLALLVTIHFNRKATNAAMVAASAASDALETDRAWLLADDFVIGHSTDITIDGVRYERGLAISLCWGNTGRSPAINVECLTAHTIIGADEAVPFFNLTPNDPRARRSTVGPNAKKIRTSFKAIGGDNYERFKRGEIQWFIYSKVLYGTVREPSRVRESQACFRIEYNGQVMDGGELKDNLIFAPMGEQNTAT